MKEKDWSDPQPDSAIQPKAQGLLYMEREYNVHHIWSKFRGLSTSQPQSNRKYLKDHSTYMKEGPGANRRTFWLLEVLEDAQPSTRRLQDSATKSSGALLCMYLTSLITIWIGVELAAVQRKLPDLVVVGLQLYSARTFHVTLSPRIYKGWQGPPPNQSTPKAIQTTTQDVGYYATRGPNLSKSLCSLHHRVPEQSIPTYKPYC